MEILKDPEANPYVDGSGFHLYGGQIEAMTRVHDAFPAKHLYFTEQMVIESPTKPTIGIVAPVRRLIIGAKRNRSRHRLVQLLTPAGDDRGRFVTFLATLTGHGSR